VRDVQDEVDIAYAADGSYAVVWTSANSDGDLDGVYYQRYDANGNAIGGETLVNTTTADIQRAPAIAMDDAGNAVVVWQSTNQDKANSKGIFAQRFDASGNMVGTEFQVNVDPNGDQTYADVAIDSSGNFVVVWELSGGATSGIYARMFDWTTTVSTTDIKINTTDDQIQQLPKVALDPSGGFVVIWESDHEQFLIDGTLGNYDVYGQRVSSTGTLLGGEFKVNTESAYSQRSTDIATDANGNFVVVWQTYGQDEAGSYGIFAQLYDASGNKVGTEFQVNSYTTGSQTDPSVAMDDAGNFVVTWQSQDQDGDAYGIYARQFDAAGTALGSDFLVNTTTAGTQIQASIGMSGGGDFGIAWSGAGTGDVDGVFVQRYLQGTGINFTVGDGVNDATMTFGRHQHGA
jgi:hypothetical protein